MKQFYILFITIFLHLHAQARSDSYAQGTKNERFTDTTKTKISSKSSSKITDTRLDKPDFLKTGIRINLTPFKPLIIRAQSRPTTTEQKAQPPVSDEKVLSNVKVFPNPVEDEINLSYTVNKESNVTIKIMDVLGNEIAILLSQRLPAGEQTNTFNIASRLNTGFYFIQLIVGSEVVVKRISVL